ncbi:MAG: hypothetical protein M3258_03680 [Thermoproteota archaeon]|nr:hypothetical protein [Thermoproteota archaeon]
MQFNSVDIQDSKNLLLAIAWLNENTEDNSVIVGEKHCRGFMEPYLVDGRTYLFQMTQLPLLLHCRSKAALRTFFLHNEAHRPHLVYKKGACKNNGGYLVTVKSNLEYRISFSNLEITIYSFNIQEKGVRVIGFATSI